MILDGVVPPLLVLLTATALLGGRRAVWGPAGSGLMAPPAWNRNPADPGPAPSGYGYPNNASPVSYSTAPSYPSTDNMPPANTVPAAGLPPYVTSVDPNDSRIVAATIIGGTEAGPGLSCTNGEDARCVLAGLTVSGLHVFSMDFWRGLRTRIQ